MKALYPIALIGTYAAVLLAGVAIGVMCPNVWTAQPERKVASKTAKVHHSGMYVVKMRGHVELVLSDPKAYAHIVYTSKPMSYAVAEDYLAYYEDSYKSAWIEKADATNCTTTK